MPFLGHHRNKTIAYNNAQIIAMQLFGQKMLIAASKDVDSAPASRKDQRCIEYQAHLMIQDVAVFSSFSCRMGKNSNWQGALFFIAIQPMAYTLLASYSPECL